VRVFLLLPSLGDSAIFSPGEYDETLISRSFYSTTEGGTCRMIFDKSVQIKQLTVVEAHGILLFRTDKGNRFESVKR
jgi:hypothetical protein